MSLESGLVKYFAAQPSVAQKLNGAFYPQEAPQDQSNQGPYVVYRIIDSDEPRDTQGSRVSQKFTFELGCFAPNFDDMIELKELVKEAVGGPSGNRVNAIIDGTPVTMFWADNAEHYQKVSTQSKVQHLVYLDLEVLLRGLIGSITGAAEVVIQS